MKYSRIILIATAIIFSSALCIWSFPHPDLNWLIWFALVPILVAVNEAGFWKGFLIGTVFGFIFIFFITRWLGLFGWEPITFASLYFGIFYGLFFGTWGWLSRKYPPGVFWQKIVIPAALWTFVEWLRAQGLFAFTWGQLGYTQYRFISLLQVSSYTGVYGITFLIVVFNNLLAQTIISIKKTADDLGIEFWKEFPRKTFQEGLKGVLNHVFKPGSKTSSSLRLGWIAFVSIFLGLIVLGRFSIPFQTQYGAYEELGAKALSVGVVQPNFPQDIKWLDRSLKPTLSVLKKSTRKLADKKAKLIIWPETSIPHGDPLNTPRLKNFLFNTAKNNGVYLITGLIERSADGVFNTAVLVRPDLRELQKYRKIHLVPLAEYFPFPETYRKFELFDRVGNYDHGKKYKVFQFPGGKFSVLICFESMFDYLARRMVKNGAQFLVVITNDAWFLKSNAARIHFIMSVFRAVENRAWVVQSANTGISGVIDPWGRIIISTEIFERESFKKNIYPQDAGTFYTAAGNWFPILCLLITITGFFIPAGVSENKKDEGKTPVDE